MATGEITSGFIALIWGLELNLRIKRRPVDYQILARGAFYAHSDQTDVFDGFRGFLTYGWKTRAFNVLDHYNREGLGI